MSVVKKFQIGGTIPSTWQEYAANSIGKMNFSNKGKNKEDKDYAEAYMIDAANKFKELYEGEGENITNVFSIDPLTKTYTVNLDKMTNEALKQKGADYWTGSIGEAKPNILGNYTTKDIKGEEGSGQRKYMGIAASMFSDWLKTKNQDTPINSEKKEDTEQRKQTEIVKLGDYIKSTKFKPEIENFVELYKRGKTNEELKELIRQDALSLINKSIQDASENPNIEFKDLGNSQKMKEILEDPNFNWDTFIDQSYKLGWNPESFLLSDDELAQIKEKEQIIENEKKLLESNETANKLLELNFNSELIPGIIEGGFNKIYSSDNLPLDLNIPELNTILKETGSYLIGNDNGEVRIINPSTGLIDYQYKKPGSKNFGQYIKLGKYFNEDVPGFDNSWSQDPYSGKTFRKITGTASGYPEHEIYEIPSKDGNVSHVFLRDPITKKDIELVKKGDNYVRVDNPEETVILDMKEYDSDFQPTELDQLLSVKMFDSDINDPFREIPLIKPEENNDDIFKSAEDFTKITDDNKNLGNLLGKLKYISRNDPSFQNREKAAKEYIRISSRFAQDIDTDTIQKIINNYSEKLKETSKIKLFSDPKYTSVENTRVPEGLEYLKKGGILKLGFGGTAESEKYLKLLRESSPQTTESKSKSNNEIRDVRGTLEDMNSLEKASLATSAVSIIPGFGAIGGLATTGLDIANDLKETGKVDWGNLAMNLGFTGLSLVGLGSLGAASRLGKSAAKVGKVASKVAKTAKNEAKLISGLEKVAKAEAKGIKTFKSLGVHADELSELKKIGLVSKKASVTTGLKKGLTEEASKHLSTLQKLPKQPSFLGKEFEGTVKGIKATGDWLYKNREGIGKAVKYLPAVPMGLGVATSGVSAVKDASEGGFKNIQHEDLKNLLLTAGGIRSYLKSNTIGNNAKKLVKSKNNILKIGSGKNAKSYKLKEELDIPDLEKPKGFSKFSKERKNAILEKNKKKIEDFKIKVSNEIGKENLPSNFDELLESKDLNKVFNVSESIEGVVPFKESGMDIFDYNRAISALKGKMKGFMVNKYGLPSSAYYNVGTKPISFNKEGGILKFQNNGIFPDYLGRRVEGNTEILSPTESYRDRLPWLKNTQGNVGTNTIGEVSVIGKKPISNGTGTGIGTISLPKLKKEIDWSKISSGINKISEYSTPALNTLMLYKGNIANRNIAKELQKANTEGLFNEPLMSRINIPVSSYTSAFYDKQAADTEALGKRVSETTSDFDKGLRARLSTNKQASDIRLQGKIKDQEIINQLRREQLGIDQTTSQYNLGAVARNAQRMTDARKSSHLIEQNRLASDFNNWLNMVTAQNEWIKNRRLQTEQKEKAKSILDIMSSDEYKQSFNDYKELSDPEYLQKAKNEYEANLPESQKNAIPWEESDKYKEILEKRKLAYNKWLNNRNRVDILNNLMKGYYNLPAETIREYADNMATIYKSGGSLNDKMLLEDKKLANKVILKNIEYLQKKSLKQTEEAIKNISKNNELLQKSLIKIFK